MSRINRQKGMKRGVSERRTRVEKIQRRDKRNNQKHEAELTKEDKEKEVNKNEANSSMISESDGGRMFKGDEETVT